MKRIYCTDTFELIPPEFFGQGKAMFCNGKPYLLSAAHRLGLKPDSATPVEFLELLMPSAATRAIKKTSIRKIYCTDTFEKIPHEFFVSGKAVWCGGKPYLAEAAKRRGLTPDPAPPPSYVPPQSESGAGITPPPLSLKPPPLPPSAILKRGQKPAGENEATVASEQTPAPVVDDRLRAQLGNVPWTPPPPEPTPAPPKAGEYAAIQTPTPTPTPTPTLSARRGQTSIGLVIGQKMFGRYDVKKVLGKGAMGEVLHVTDVQSHIEYALKRLPPDVSAEKREWVRKNFHLTSQLTHPHIATTRNLEIDPRNGNIFILMDLVRGQDMARWMATERQKRGARNAPLPVELTLCVAEQIASALDYAHSQPVNFDEEGNPTKFGILHRDLKPANVMVETTRQYRSGVPYVRIVDFGLATESQASLEEISQPQRNKKAGTPVYMAPEQWEGRTLTRGVDQWALAVILYEMLSGERPFWDNTEFLLMQKIFKADPPKPATLTDAQFAVLQKTFNPDRRKRHHSCLALVKALAAADPATKNVVLAAEFPMPEDFLPQEE